MKGARGMEHLAIMKRSWGLIPKILSREKRIESRWYSSRRAPWGRISRGDRVFFRNSGEAAVIAEARVSDVAQFEGLTPAKVKALLEKQGKDDGIAESELPRYFARFRDKRYCILVFLKGARRVEAPFEVDKSGFGAMCAWLTAPYLPKRRLPEPVQ